MSSIRVAEVDPRWVDLAAKLYERLVLDAELRQFAEENGIDPEEHHRELARRAIAAAATFDEEVRAGQRAGHRSPRPRAAG